MVIIVIHNRNIHNKKKIKHKTCHHIKKTHTHSKDKITALCKLFNRLIPPNYIFHRNYLLKQDYRTDSYAYISVGSWGVPCYLWPTVVLCIINATDALENLETARRGLFSLLPRCCVWVIHCFVYSSIRYFFFIWIFFC